MVFQNSGLQTCKSPHQQRKERNVRSITMNEQVFVGGGEGIPLPGPYDDGEFFWIWWSRQIRPSPQPVYTVTELPSDWSGD
jgi:hypothetical protein